MKTLTLFIALAFCGHVSSQSPNPTTPPSPGAPGANTGGSTPVPVNPGGQTTLPYNGTNPAGEPNQVPASPQQPAIPGSNYQPAVQPNPVVPTQPAVPPIGTNPYKNINRLFQDPARTPSEPKAVSHGSEHPVDGSRGKYHKPKKAMSASTFAHNRTHIRKSGGGGNKEKSHASTSSTK